MVIAQDIPSQLEQVPVFIEQFIDKLKPFSLRHNQVFDIKLSLEEALVNAIKHGNKMDPALAIGFKARIEEGCLVMEVANFGPGFDFASIPDPTEDDRLERTSGRGIFLIKKLMDKVEFQDSGRLIKMVKFITGGNKNEDKPGED